MIWVKSIGNNFYYRIVFLKISIYMDLPLILRRNVFGTECGISLNTKNRRSLNMNAKPPALKQEVCEIIENL